MVYIYYKLGVYSINREFCKINSEIYTVKSEFILSKMSIYSKYLHYALLYPPYAQNVHREARCIKLYS